VGRVQRGAIVGCGHGRKQIACHPGNLADDSSDVRASRVLSQGGKSDLITLAFMKTNAYQPPGTAYSTLSAPHINPNTRAAEVAQADPRPAKGDILPLAVPPPGQLAVAPSARVKQALARAVSKRTKAVLAAMKANYTKEPGWVLMEQQEKSLPRSVWADPDRYRSKPVTASPASKPDGVQPPEQRPKDSAPVKPRPAGRPSKQASNAVLEKNEIQPLLLNTKDVCRLLGMCPRSLARLEQRGLVHSVNLLRTKLYSHREIESFAESLCKWKA